MLRLGTALLFLLPWAPSLHAQGCGDCNGDQAVSILDALLAAQTDAGITAIGAAASERCDVDASGRVTVLDALRIAQSGVGGVVTLDCSFTLCEIGGIEYVAGQVDPTSPCRWCEPQTSVSSWTPLPDGLACDDGDLCTFGEQCMGGLCVGGAPLPCPPGAVCNPATGLCQ